MLNRNFKVYVPSIVNGKVDRPLQERMAERAMDDFAVMFGGGTVTNALSVWKDASGRLVKEPTILVESFTDSTTALTHEGDVFALAAMVASLMRQSSVALEVSGELHLVTPEEVLACAA